MSVQGEFIRCLEALDIQGVQRIWGAAASHLPQPATDYDTLIALHMARTTTRSIPIKLRLYSHRWLLDECLPSQLPDELKPEADRLYPAKTKAVGVSVNTRVPEFKPAVLYMRDAINDAISEAFEDGHTDTKFVRNRMWDARVKSRKQMFGQFVTNHPVKAQLFGRED